MHPDIRTYLAHERDAEIAREAERSRHIRGSRRVRTRRPRGNGDPFDI